MHLTIPMTVTCTVSNGLCVQLASQAQWLADSSFDLKEWNMFTRGAQPVQYALTQLIEPELILLALPGVAMRYSCIDEPHLGHDAADDPYGTSAEHHVKFNIEVEVEVTSAHAVQLVAFAQVVDQGDAQSHDISQFVDVADDALTVKAVLALLEPEYLCWFVPSAWVAESAIDPEAVTIGGRRSDDA